MLLLFKVVFAFPITSVVLAIPLHHLTKPFADLTYGAMVALIYSGLFLFAIKGMQDVWETFSPRS